MMIMDAESIALLFLFSIRFMVFIAFIIHFFRGYQRRYLIFALGWLIYALGALITVFRPHSGGEYSLILVLYTAIAANILFLSGVLHYTDNNKKITKLILVSIFISVTIISIFIPKLLFILQPVLQGSFFIIILFIVIFDKSFFRIGSISFYWICIGVVLGLIYSVSLKFLFNKIGPEILFVITGFLNLALISVLGYIDWEWVNKTLENSYKEKNILLKEVHHRVKNNLMIISSMVRLKSDSIENENAKYVLRSVENRIDSMSIVYEQLYRSNDLANIKFYDYILDLTEIINFGSSEIKPVDIKYELDDISFNINLLIPVGMLVNELITNSYKHAFADIDKPEVIISLKAEKDNSILITVMDNGTGLAEEYLDLDNAKTTGFIIIKALVGQIKGDIQIKTGYGTKVSIRIPHQEGIIYKNKFS